MAKFADVFNKLDVNGDGSVDKNELKQGCAAGIVDGTDDAKVREFFATLDANGDQRVTRAEFMTFYETLIDQMIALAHQ